MLFGDCGPVVNGKPVFAGYLFTPARRFAWHELDRQGVVTILQGEVTQVELEAVHRMAEEAAKLAADHAARQRKTPLGRLGDRVTLLGRNFVLKLDRGAVVAVPE